MLSSLQRLEDFVGKQLPKVENSVSKQGSESKVEGMVSLLLLGKTGHFSATKVSERGSVVESMLALDLVEVRGEQIEM